MRVAIVDIGSNTVRLLVAEQAASGPVRVRGEKAYLGLGAEILRNGSIGDEKLAEAGAVARRFVQQAHRCGAGRIDVLVTAPGRQAANADELLHVLARSTRTPVRAVSADEEAALAFAGAVVAEPELTGTVAVVDVGGGSTEIAVGDASGVPAWSRSVDIGSLRLSVKALPSDPPTREELEAAHAEVAAAFATIEPPAADAARAVGGSARALARVIGRTLGESELEAAVKVVSGRRSGKVARTFGLDQQRVRVLPAGAIVLGRVAGLLGVPLRLARGGLREGAAAILMAEDAAA
jgi:exopolyphosphatase/guanosine-5'-triphosphate,3'-diphosphate pyrophosphatase